MKHKLYKLLNRIRKTILKYTDVEAMTIKQTGALSVFAICLLAAAIGILLLTNTQ